MSEQGKILSWEEWVRKNYTPKYVKRIFDGGFAEDEAILNYKIYQLRTQLTTAETAATEYAQQAAELQEEVETYKKALVLAYKDTVTPKELDLILTALRKARGE